MSRGSSALALAYAAGKTAAGLWPKFHVFIENMRREGVNPRFCFEAMESRMLLTAPGPLAVWNPGALPFTGASVQTNAPGGITLSPLGSVSVQNGACVGDVAMFTGLAGYANPASYTATVTWTDGITDSAAVVAGPGVFAIVANHPFAASVPTPVSVTVCNASAGCTATAVFGAVSIWQASALAALPQPQLPRLSDETTTSLNSYQGVGDYSVAVDFPDGYAGDPNVQVDSADEVTPSGPSLDWSAQDGTSPDESFVNNTAYSDEQTFTVWQDVTPTTPGSITFYNNSSTMDLRVNDTIIGVNAQATFDLNGTSDAAAFTATLQDPLVTANGPSSVNGGASYFLNLAQQPGSTLASVEIAWGDSTIPQSVDISGGLPLSLSHIYDDGPADHTILVTATDTNATTTTFAQTLSVLNAPLVVTPIANQQAYTGDTVSGLGTTFTDPGAPAAPVATWGTSAATTDELHRWLPGQAVDQGGSTLTDLGSGDTAASFAGSGESWVAGPDGSIDAIQCDNSDMGVHAPVTDLPYDTPFTVSLWCKSTSGSAFAVTDSSQSTQWELGTYNGQIFFGTWWSVNYISANLQDGNWHQLAVDFNGASVTIYADGVAAAAPIPWSGTANPFTGIDLCPTNGAGPGAFADVRIFARALSSAEVAALAQRPATTPSIVNDGVRGTSVATTDELHRWLPGQAVDQGGSTLTDLGSGDTAAAFAGSGESWVAGPDGSIDAIQCNNSDMGVHAPVTDLPYDTPFTISLWCKSTSGSVFAVTDSSQNTQWELGTYGGQIFFGTWWSVNYISADLQDGNWHQLAVDFNGASVTIYADGVAAAAPIPWSGTANPFTGIDLCPINGAGPGAFADVRIFARALSASEVAALAGLPATATVAWGDGQTQAALVDYQTGAVTLPAHQYQYTGSYNASLTVTDADGASGSSNFTVTAGTPQITLSAAVAPIAATEGQVYTNPLATFVDTANSTNDASVYATSTITWNSTQIDSATVTWNSAAACFEVTDSTAPAMAGGSVPVAVTIINTAGNECETFNLNAAVADPAPVITAATGLAANARQDLGAGLLLATFTGASANPDNFSATLSDANGDDLSAAVTWDSANSCFDVTAFGNFSAAGDDQGLSLEIDDNTGGASATQAIAISVAETVPAAPDSLTAAIAVAGVTLSWTASPGATSYNIYRDGAALITATPDNCAVVGGAWTYTDATGTATDRYQVTAVNNAGQSEPHPVTPAPQDVWSLDAAHTNVAGGTATDSGAVPSDLTLGTGWTQVPGGGITGGDASPTCDPTYLPSTDLTLAFSMRGTTGAQFVVGLGDAAGWASGFSVYGDGTAAIGAMDTIGVPASQISNDFDGNYHRLALTLDDNGTADLYFDGAMVGSSPFAPITYADGSLYIMPGSPVEIKDVCVYPAALTGPQIVDDAATFTGADSVAAQSSADTPSLTPWAGITASARTPFSDTPIATFTDPGSDINPDDFTAMVSDANGDDLTAAVAWDSTNNDFAVKISGAMEFSGDQTLTLEVDNNAVPGGASTLADIPATVSETTPAVPQYLQATAVATGEIDLSWDAAAGAATYIVSRAPAGSQVFQTIACVSAATSYADDYLPAHTTYQYQVTAANTAGANNSVLASAPSNTALTQTLDTPPVALDDGLNSDGSYAYSVCHDRTLAITASYNGVLANDHDADYDSLTAQLVGQAQHGNVTLNANGTFTYTPDAGYVGPDSFTYGVYDGFEHSNVATVSIDVTNTPPTAQGATFTDYPGLSLNGISLSAYAADGDYDPRTYSLVSGLSPDEGTLTFHAATGTFDYTAPSDFVGSVTFAWKVNDGAADSNVATATINVTDIAPPMHAVNDVYTASVGYPLQLTGNGAQSITYNDANTSCATVVMVGNPAYGSLATDQYGHWFYTPDSGVTAPTLDTFTYCLQRNGQTSNTATVTILVLPVGFSGRAGDYISTPCYGYWDGQNWYTNTLSWAVHQGQELSVLAGNGLMKYATAADNPNDTVAVSTTGTVATAQGGTVNINADGGFTYTPAAGYVGPDTFNFTLVDTSTNVSSQFSGMVNVTDAAPAAAGPLSVWTSQGQNATITPSISDPDNYTAPPLDTLTPAIVQQPAHGSVAINSQGNFVYTPDANFTGVDVFTYDVNDGALNSNAATVQINVQPITLSLRWGGGLSNPANNQLSPDGQDLACDPTPVTGDLVALAPEASIGGVATALADFPVGTIFTLSYTHSANSGDVRVWGADSTSGDPLLGVPVSDPSASAVTTVSWTVGDTSNPMPATFWVEGDAASTSPGDIGFTFAATLPADSSGSQGSGIHPMQLGPGAQPCAQPGTQPATDPPASQPSATAKATVKQTIEAAVDRFLAALRDFKSEQMAANCIDGQSDINRNKQMRAVEVMILTVEEAASVPQKEALKAEDHFGPFKADRDRDFSQIKIAEAMDAVDMVKDAIGMVPEEVAENINISLDLADFKQAYQTHDWSKITPATSKLALDALNKISQLPGAPSPLKQLLAKGPSFALAALVGAVNEACNTYCNRVAEGLVQQAFFEVGGFQLYCVNESYERLNAACDAVKAAVFGPYWAP